MSNTSKPTKSQPVTDTIAESISETVGTITGTIRHAVTTVVNDARGRVDLTRLDVRSVDLPKFEMPTFEMPKFQMPKLDMPTVDVPKFELPVEGERVAELARDAAYVGVGVVVVTAERLDHAVRTVAGSVSDTVTAGVRQLVDTAGSLTR